jgi:alpha-ketoglutarate-dependent taurine dioxygenase
MKIQTSGHEGDGHRCLPFVIQATPESADVSQYELLDWIVAERTWLDGQLHNHGALLLRGFRSLRASEDFEDVMRRVSTELLDYAGGHTPRTAVQGKIVSSTDAPCHLMIGLHQEMSYLEPSPSFPDPTPDQVAFFCLVAPGGGGQTPICDMRLVYQRLPADLVHRFEDKGLILTRRLPETKEAGYEATWPTVLGATDRGEAEKFAAKRGWRVEWTSDGGACVFHKPSPVVKTHRLSGERVWFNQAHLLHKAYAPWTTDFLGASPEQKREADRLRPRLSNRFFFHSTHADGSEILISDLECIRRTIAETMVMFDWQVHDLLICDNKLVAHGRQPYQPPRTILAALANDRPPAPATAGNLVAG